METTFEPVFDVTRFGARALVCSDANTKKIQKAIDAAARAGGGVVYFPPGRYCVTRGLLGDSNITLKGASLGNLDATSASIIQTSPDFSANQAVISVPRRPQRFSGFQVENLSIQIKSGNPGIIGIDFSLVWYGAIRGVGVIGSLFDGPRRPQSEGSIGFLFSDPFAEYACFANLVERTSVAYMDTGYKFVSAFGNTTLMTVTNFWVSDVRYGVWTESVGAVGISFRDGYLSSTLGVAGKKGFRHTRGLASIVIQNVQQEPTHFDLPNDILGGQIRSEGSVGFDSDPRRADAFAAMLNGSVGVSLLHQLVGTADGTGLGAHERSPCPPLLHPPARSPSFWAMIPAGQPLTAGENIFTYYTTVGQSSRPDVDIAPPVDIYFTFHVTRNGGLTQPFQWSGRTRVTRLFHYDTITYDVSLYVASAFTLASDLVFFLQANPTMQRA